MPEDSLELVEESYGSLAVFAVMDPYTVYWQETVADTVTALGRLGTDGV